MKNRLWLVMVLTGIVLLTAGLIFQFVIRGENTTIQLTESQYEQAKRPIRELQLLNGSRPYTPQEWQLLTRTAQDERADLRLRVRAITALWQTPDVSQQREVVQLAADLLDDREPLVRAYAANALARLKAKQYLPQLERLAVSDPYPSVRESARTAIVRLKVLTR